MRDSHAIVVVSGTTNVDTFVGVNEFPHPGETIIGKKALEALGGKGANQAVACARMGVRTVLLSAIGRDQQGEFALEELRRFGVNTEYVTEAHQPTGQAFIMTNAEGENIIIVTSGANELVSPANQCSTVAEINTQSPVAVILAQGELTPKHSAELPKLLSVCDARLVLNLAPVTTKDPDLLRVANPLIVNEGEAYDLLGVRGEELELDAVLSRLREVATSVVVTLGERGAIILPEDGGEAIHVPAVRVNTVVDSTGAGDAFCGTVAAALAEGESLEDACKLGAAAGALATQKRGAAVSYATAEAVRALGEE